MPTAGGSVGRLCAQLDACNSHQGFLPLLSSSRPAGKEVTPPLACLHTFITLDASGLAEPKFVK